MNRLLAPVSRACAALSLRQQKKSVLWDPAHWHAAIDDAGHLAIDGIGLPRLVEQFGSPLLVLSRPKLLADADNFASAVRECLPDALVAISYKTNCVPGVLQQLHDAGLAAEVISPYELWLAERLRVPGDRIIVNGVNKDSEFIRHAVRLNVASVNIDEPREIEMLRKAAQELGTRVRVSVRLKVNRASHFGLGIESGEAARACDEIAKHPDCLAFQGLHFHELADNRDPEPHIRYLRRALEFAALIRSRSGLVTRLLNVGGGYGVPTVKVMSRFEYARQRLLDVTCRPPDPYSNAGIGLYMERLAAALDTICRENDLPRPRVVFEPGRIIFSQSHALLSRIHSIKHNRFGPDFAMTDIGKILTSYPCDYEYHQIFAANRMRARRTANYHLMGRLCTAADWLAKNRFLPKLESGDVIAVMDAGAYFTSYSSNFSFPRPAVVMLDEGRARTLRQRESFEHLTAMDDIERG
jgi:diaminopimelate decarboxylase